MLYIGAKPTTRALKQPIFLASLTVLGSILTGIEAKAITLINNPVNTIGCNSSLLIGNYPGNTTNNGMAGIAFTTGSISYGLDSVAVPLRGAFYDQTYVGDPSNLIVSLYKIAPDNSLLGGAIASATKDFQISNQDCKVSTVNLENFQLAANERYFLGIGTSNNILWSIFDYSLATTDGGITIQSNDGLLGYGFNNQPADVPRVIRGYGNLRLSGTELPSAPGPLPVVGLLGNP